MLKSFPRFPDLSSFPFLLLRCHCDERIDPILVEAIREEGFLQKSDIHGMEQSFLVKQAVLLKKMWEYVPPVVHFPGPAFREDAPRTQEPGHSKCCPGSHPSSLMILWLLLLRA